MSGYVYNLGNELTSMQGLVDIVRLSRCRHWRHSPCRRLPTPMKMAVPHYRLPRHSDCNGYWKRLAGLELQA